MWKTLLVLSVLLFTVFLAYGYWHVTTYGWLNISLYDSSDKDQQFRQIKDAKIQLLNAVGNILAEGKSDNRHGVVYLSHPEVGYCIEEESRAPFSRKDRQKWYDCYKKQSKWFVEWVRDVNYANLEFGKCFLQAIPVTVSESKDDWWLWWIPHPHLGGKPTTYFSINILVDGANCMTLSE